MRLPLVVAAVLLAGCAAPLRAETLPDSIAVLGDSISRAFNAAGDDFGEYPAHSWATGSDGNDSVLSHYERLRALDPTLDIVPFNNARTGARVDDLERQVALTVQQKARYVVVLIGANDVCASPAPDAVEFAQHVIRGFAALDALDARVLVASVPDVARLARLYEDNATARAVWEAFDVCPGVLGDGVDLALVEARVRAYNDVLEAQATGRGWSWDGDAVANTAYAAADVSAVDFFHPSLAGQQRIAEVTWAAGPYADWHRTSGRN